MGFWSSAMGTVQVSTKFFVFICTNIYIFVLLHLVMVRSLILE